MSVYDDPEVRQSANSNFVKFERIGDSVAGQIVEPITKGKYKDTVTLTYKLRQADGQVVTMSVGQIGLKTLLIEQRPEQGDWLAVRYTGEERAGQNIKKLFEVQVRRANQQQAPPAAAAPPEQQPPAAAPPQQQPDYWSQSAPQGFTPTAPDTGYEPV